MFAEEADAEFFSKELAGERMHPSEKRKEKTGHNGEKELRHCAKVNPRKCHKALVNSKRSSTEYRDETSAP